MEFSARSRDLLDNTFQMRQPVEFSVDEAIAPFYLRCAAVFIDYMLLLAPPVSALILSKFFDEGSSGGGVSNVVWYLVLILWLINFLAIPLFSGQTIGKMFAGITMLKMDGSPVRLAGLLRRNVVGYLLTLSTLGFGFLIAALNKNGRALHDYVGGTVLVQGRRSER